MKCPAESRTTMRKWLISLITYRPIYLKCPTESRTTEGQWLIGPCLGLPTDLSRPHILQFPVEKKTFGISFIS